MFPRFNRLILFILSFFFLIFWGNRAQAQTSSCSFEQICGSQCCAKGEICYLGKCFKPQTSCHNNTQCSSGYFCSHSEGRCLPQAKSNAKCYYKPPIGKFSPVALWEWKQSKILPTFENVMMTPLVVALQDTNGNKKIDPEDVPSVIFMSYVSGGSHAEEGVVRALRGDNGKEIFTISDRRYRVNGLGTLAVGDIDNDGFPEIIAPRYGGRNVRTGGLFAFTHTGKLKWVAHDKNNRLVPLSVGWGGASIADLNGDGKVEVILGNTVIRGSDGLVLCRGKNYTRPLSAVADINSDGKLEILVGHEAYTHNCRLLWRNRGYDGYIAVVDFDKDKRPEIVVIGSSRLQITDGQTGKIYSTTYISGGGGGPPSVADFTGDGRLEVAVAGRSYYSIYRVDPKTKRTSLLWRYKINDSSSGQTANAAFDFDGDGKAEALYGDQSYLRIFEGKTGRVLFSLRNQSSTTLENPVVADLNNDGRAELLFCSNNGSMAHIRVFRDKLDNWLGARNIWNQHNYNVTNVCAGDAYCPRGNYVGQIPKTPLKNWLQGNLNHFRQNTIAYRKSKNDPVIFSSADLTAIDFKAQWSVGCTGKANASARILNQGAKRIPSIPVTFYQGDPRGHHLKLTTIWTNTILRPGESIRLKTQFSLNKSYSPIIYIRIDDDGTGHQTRNECNKFNNLLMTKILPPMKELCDGKDNDCDGRIDEDFTNKGKTCYAGTGQCRRSGKYVCSSDQRRTICNAQPGNPTTESCDNRDNDCDGRIDNIKGTSNPIKQVCYSGPPSTRHRGECKDGIRFCRRGSWGACQNQVLPTSELCDGKDNDCNGRIDENFTNKGKTCYVGVGQCRRSGKYICSSDQKRTICNAKPGTPSTEKCDGIDNDCDGGIDNIKGTKTSLQQACYTGNPQTRHVGECKDGSQSCQAGHWSSCVGQILPQKEICDAKDNDCDGQIDEQIHCPTPPQIAGVPSEFATSSIEYTYAPKVVDNDPNDTHTWKGLKLPPGAKIDPKTGKVSWTPKPSDKGKTFEFEIQVCDNTGLCATQAWKVKVNNFNHPPQIVGTPATKTVSNKPYTYSPKVQDADSTDTHTWKLDKGPSGASIDPKTGKISWIPDANDVGKTFEFTVTVCDQAGACATQTWKVLVTSTNPNTPPQIDGTPATQAMPEKSYTYEPKVIDPDAGDKHIWSLKKAPKGAKIDPKTGKISWTPSPEDAGSTVVFEIEVCDQGGDCATQTWKVEVKQTNTPPTISGTPATQIDAGKQYSYKPSVTDPDPNDTHSWKLTQGPAGAKIDPKTGAVSWPTTKKDEGKTATFEIEVCDDKGLCAKQKWTVTVGKGNQGPTISTQPPLKATPQKEYSYEPNAKDPDGDPLKWTLKNAPKGAKIDPNTGKITWTPDPKDAGTTAKFEIEVCDDKGHCSSQSWRVVVPSYHPPQIDGTPKTTTNAGKLYEFAPNVKDEDPNATHKWTLKNAPKGAKIDPKTGKISWTPDPKDAGKKFTFEVEVCNDKGLCASRKWKVKVNGQANTPPVIVGAPSNNAVAGKNYTFEPKVLDPDKGDSHKWTLKNAPKDAKIDPKTGKISWTPTASDVGKEVEFEVEVCDDKGACTSRKWKVLVSKEDVTGPPQMTGTPATTTKPNQTYTFEPHVKNPIPGEKYSWKLGKAPAGAKVDPKTGKISWTPSSKDVGKVFLFELTLCDSHGRCTKRTWKVRVTVNDDDINTPPTITSTPPDTARAGNPYEYSPKATDPDKGDSLTWKLKKAPKGAKIDPKTGKVTWTPTSADNGKNIDFEIEVCDKHKTCDSQSWTVGVSNRNQPPKITSAPPQHAYTGQNFTYQATAKDPDPKDTLTWKLLNAPAGAKIDPKTGKISWKPSTSDAGKEATFTIQVCDNGTPRLCDTQTFRITPQISCDVDSNCQGDDICIPDETGHYICNKAGCAKRDPKCLKGNFCSNGSCQKNPCLGKQCAQDETCRPSDGKCIASCAGVTCPNNETCVDGKCTQDPCAAAGNNCKKDEICDNSDPQNPTCKKNPCTASSCRHGRLCQNGHCIDDPCEQMTCPAPNKERCFAGQCTDLQPCNVDVDCPNSEVCEGGKCHPAGCYLNNALCNSGELCLKAQCATDSCPESCAKGEFCRQGESKCVKSCGQVRCQKDERCVDGQCINNPCASVSCNSGESCDPTTGKCRINHCNASNLCRHGRICSESQNKCVDDPCAYVECGNHELCRDGQCIFNACRFDKDCSDDKLCIKNQCVKPDCHANSDCQNAQLCIDGKCVNDSCDGKNCKDSQFCRDGKCIDSCAGVFCDKDKICRQGQCVDDPCKGIQCKQGERCHEGKCLTDLCASETDPCKDNRLCQIDECVHDPCQTMTCPKGQTCKDGDCTGDRTCNVDVECPGESICVKSICVPPGCYKEQNCQSTEVCTDANCEKDLCKDKQCPDGEFCQPNDGSCTKPCPKCPDGEICKDGQCQKDPCDGVSCAKDESCKDGQCEKDACSDTTQKHCRFGRICQHNHCMNDPCSNVNCPADSTCKNGFCINTKEDENSTSTEMINDAGQPDTPANNEAMNEAHSNGDQGTSSDKALPPLVASGGCGCSLSQNTTLPSSFLLLFSLLLLFKRRRS